MDEHEESPGKAAVRLAPAQYALMTSDERAAAIAALAALLAHARRESARLKSQVEMTSAR